MIVQLLYQSRKLCPETQGTILLDKCKLCPNLSSDKEVFQQGTVFVKVCHRYRLPKKHGKLDRKFILDEIKTALSNFSSDIDAECEEAVNELRKF